MVPLCVVQDVAPDPHLRVEISSMITERMTFRLEQRRMLYELFVQALLLAH
jgi:hypothetical protein